MIRPLLALALISACSDPATTVVMIAGSEAPAYGTTPFPTDALREGDHLAKLEGLETVVERNAEKVALNLAALDGFGLRPLVEFPVTAPIDPATVEGHAFVLDLETRREIAMEWRFDAVRNVIQGKPLSGELLREGAAHVAFVTTDVLDASGAPIARSGALDDLSGPRWASTAAALHAISRDDIAGFTVFTTQHASAPLLAAREVLATLPPSTLTFPDAGVIFNSTSALDSVIGQATRATDGPRSGLERWGNDNATGIAHDHVGVVGSGVMTSARFRQDDTGTNDGDDETFTRPPTVISVDNIPVTFVLPATAMPATGYPIVIYGHGLGASRDQLLSFAEPLTSRGYAVVGIDMTGHGSRFLATDQLANMANQLVSFSGETGVRDGFGDTTGQITQFDFFEGFLGVGAVRDSIRQSALDLSRLTQLLRQSSLDLTALAGPGTSTPKLDTTRIAYLGESFGTVVGTLFAAIEPNIGLFVLDVPGGGILDTILPSSPEIGGPAIPLIEAVYVNLQPLDRWNPLIGLMQTVIDGGDPLTYAPHILTDRFSLAGTPLPPRSVVALEVLGDQVLCNAGTEALARGLGLAVLTPDLAPPAGLAEIASPAAANLDGQTAVLVQYAPATHGANWSAERGTLRYMPGFPFEGETPFPRLPHAVTIANPIYETHAQVAEILATYFAGDAPRVRSTRAPVADFDDDGTPDAADPNPLDPAAR